MPSSPSFFSEEEEVGCRPLISKVVSGPRLATNFGMWPFKGKRLPTPAVLVPVSTTNVLLTPSSLSPSSHYLYAFKILKKLFYIFITKTDTK